VSVGGLLALDQVFRKHWLELAHFCTSTHWSRKVHLGGDEISHLFCGLCGPGKGFFRDFLMGCGISSHGVFPCLSLL
jgi:hypothetical protein